jgi:indolepyruvate ferredoxin oxidoreductase, beta subunit
MTRDITNIVVAGLGGQGVIRASDILADAAFLAGYDVKKAELHGMSQRGGSVSSDVRFGKRVLSPMVPAGEADFLVVLEDSQIDPTRHYLRPGGTMLCIRQLDVQGLPSAKALNVGMLGMLSAFLEIPESAWLQAMKAGFPPPLHEANEQAFRFGAAAGRKVRKENSHV